MWISKNHQKHLASAEQAAYRSPIPTQMVSNGEYMPLAQTRQQREVEESIKELADKYGKKLGLSRREFVGQREDGVQVADRRQLLAARVLELPWRCRVKRKRALLEATLPGDSPAGSSRR